MEALPIVEIMRNRAAVGIGPKRRKERGLKLGLAPKRAEMEYRRQLVAISREMSLEIERVIIPLLERLEPQFVKKTADSRIVIRDSVATELATAFAAIRSNLKDQDAIAKVMAARHISTTTAAERKRFFTRLESTVGIDLQGVISEEGLQDILELSSATNTNLITSLPNDQLAKVEELIFRNTLEGATAKSLTEEIKSLGDISEARARFIARDQTAKLNSALTQARHESLGIFEYRWRSQRDGLRVRLTHRQADAMSRGPNGRKFRYDTPPKVTGGDHPGQAPRCRCTAEGVIPGLDD